MQPVHTSCVKLSTAYSAILFELCELQQARDTRDLIPGTWCIGMRGMHERFLFMSHRGDDYMDGCMKEGLLHTAPTYRQPRGIQSRRCKEQDFNLCKHGNFGCPQRRGTMYTIMGRIADAENARQVMCLTGDGVPYL